MKLPKRFVAFSLACVMACSLLEFIPARASNISSIQQEINQNQTELNKVNNQLSKYEAEREEYQSYLDDQKSEMMNLMKDIAYYETAIADKEVSITNATSDLEEANEDLNAQYDAMMIRIQYMYERGGEENYLLLLLTSQDFTDLLNRADYIDSLYNYDRQMLADYQQLVTDITQMRDNLETEKAALVKEQEALDAHKVELERIMADLKSKISDYDKLVANAEAQAKKYKDQIASGQNQIAAIKKAEEEALRQQLLLQQQQQNNNSGSQVSGSGTGADIANYACQFVGNPYVWGGTSLTNGADCSGFIMTIYKQYGYSLPHSSYSMRSSGTKVNSLDEAVAGDIICYSGHVAIYLGNGRIVHAKSSKYGIVTDPVYYGWGGTGPQILAIRRIIK